MVVGKEEVQQKNSAVGTAVCPAKKEVWRWVKCAMCRHVFISRAKEPQCSKCRSMRTMEAKIMATKKEEVQKPEEKSEGLKDEQFDESESDDLFEEENDDFNTLMDED